jgi:hypothetical protein
VINVGTIVAAHVPPLSPADEDGDDEEGDTGIVVEFEYSADGVAFFPITAPAPSELPGYSVLWNTARLPGEEYVLRARMVTGTGPDLLDSITVFVNEQPHAFLEVEPAGPPQGVQVQLGGSYRSRQERQGQEE